MTDTIPTIEVFEEPIELCKLLKIANMVSGGGEAKIVISEGYVYLNGEVEIQKRKKVYQGDIVEFNGELFEMTVNTAGKTSKTVQDTVLPKSKLKTNSKEKSNNKSTQKSQKKNKTQNKTNTNTKETSDFSSEVPVKHKRKPISF